MILFVNTCVRPESRTRWLAERVLERIRGGDDVQEIRPMNAPLTNEMLARRTRLAEQGNFDGPVFEDARLLVSASQVVIAAPFWDLSFPASLKAWVEATGVVGLTFAYREDGQSYGLCRARRLVYVTTAGGPIASDVYGYGYIRELARTFWGIPEVLCAKAEGLDIIGVDVQGILNAALDAFGYPGE